MTTADDAGGRVKLHWMMDGGTEDWAREKLGWRETRALMRPRAPSITAATSQPQPPPDLSRFSCSTMRAANSSFSCSIGLGEQEA